MLKDIESFELENEYEQICDVIRYKKVDELSDFTEEITKLLNNNIDDKLLFHGDCEKFSTYLKR